MLKRTMMAVILGILVGAGFYAVADDANLRDKDACKEDVKTFCKDVKPGQGRIQNCLEDHLSELAADCKDTVEDRANIADACKADKEKFCPDTKVGRRDGADVRKCMKEHEAELSQTCKDARETAKADESTN